MRERLRPVAVGGTFGVEYAHPFGFAPVGYAGAFWPAGEEIMDVVARERQLPMILSCSSVASVERAAALADGRLWFQLYVARDRAIAHDMTRRAKAAGIDTLVVTVDVPTLARRYRNPRNRFRLPLPITPSLVADVLSHPRWLLNYLRHGGLPAMGNWVPYAPAGASPAEVSQVLSRNVGSGLNWDDIDDIRQRWPGKLVLKGLLHPEDAARAVARGVDGVIVSNHGGRQSDRLVSSLQMLPEIVAAAGEKPVVMFDGGVSSGADVVVAYMLGARFVFCGRAPIWGLSAAGERGVRRAVEILGGEIDNTLAQTGAVDLADARANGMLRVMHQPNGPA